MAGPNGGSKKVKSIGLSSLDNKNLIICVNELTLAAVNHTVAEIKSTVGIDVDVNAKVATPVELVMSGDWTKSNVVIAWIANEIAYMAPMDVFITNVGTIMHASVTVADGMTSHIYGMWDAWTTTLPLD